MCATALWSPPGTFAGLTATYTVAAGNPEKADTSKILNYNADMEYRRCGKTNWMVSAVCLGGHWKRVNKVVPDLFKGESWLGINVNNPEFEKNRHDVVTRCIERGINYIDACTSPEVLAYAKALRGRRDKMYLGYSWYEREMRGLSSLWQKAKKAGKPMEPGWITKKLQESFDNGLKKAELDYVDVWRITCHEGSSGHTDAEIEEMVAALEWAKKSGRARFTGISSHDRPPHQEAYRGLPADGGDLHALHRQDQGGHRRERPLGRHEEARRRLVRHQAVRPAIRSSRETVRPPVRTPRRTAGSHGWHYATSSATRPSPRRSPA